MGTVIIREYEDMARPRSGGANVGTYVLEGVLLTDKYGLAIKTVTTVGGSSVPSAPVSDKTHFVALESTVECRYAVKPKERVDSTGKSIPNSTAFVATANHSVLPASAAGDRHIVIEAVYPGAVICFLE